MTLRKLFDDHSLRARTILDVGCGPGEISMMMMDWLQAESVYGVDISSKMTLRAQATGVNATVIDLDKSPLPWPDQTFDFIFFGETIEHLYDPDRTLGEIFRVAKTGAHLVVTTPNLVWWANRFVLLLGYQPFQSEISLKTASIGKMLNAGDKPSGHIRLFTPRSLASLLEFNNFHVIELRGAPLYSRIKGVPLKGVIDNLLSRRSSFAPVIVCLARKP